MIFCFLPLDWEGNIENLINTQNMKFYLNAILMALVLSLGFVACGEKDNDIYVSKLDLANDKAELEGIAGAAGEKIQEAISAAESEDFSTALTAMIDAVKTNKLKAEELEALHTFYGTLSAYFAAKPELRVEDVLKLEQQYGVLWDKAYAKTQ